MLLTKYTCKLQGICMLEPIQSGSFPTFEQRYSWHGRRSASIFGDRSKIKKAHGAVRPRHTFPLVFPSPFYYIISGPDAGVDVFHGCVHF